MKLLALVVLFSTGLLSCNAPRKAAAGAGATSAACPTTGMPAVRFYGAKLPANTVAATLPKRYAAYAVSAAEWKAFATKVKERGPKEVTGLNIPLPSGCKGFSVTVSSTMSPELAAKYPELASMKGSAPDGSDLRLDWNGTAMRGQIIAGGDTYFLEPHTSGSETFYLIYHKADASATKQAFE